MSRPRHALAAALALLALPAVARAQWADEDEAYSPERRPRLSITAWGGEAFATGSRGSNGAAAGGELAWAFDSLEVGAQGGAYRLRAGREWSPVVLLRLTERFETRRGFEASFTFGVGAGETTSWITWYQIALGGRLYLSSALYLAGEVSFEQYDLLRLAGGIGVRF